MPLAPMTDTHPLSRMFREAAFGRFPPADGGLDILAAPEGKVQGVVAFSGHNVIAAGVDPAWVLSRLDPTDIAAPMSPAFLSALGQLLGAKPSLVDVGLAALGRSGPFELELEPADPAIDHPRVARALLLRTDVRVFTAAGGAAVLTLGRGLAGRLDASFEVEEAQRNRGLGRALVRAALTLAGEGEPLFMQVAPGNAASLRAILACGFRPIGAEVLFLKAQK